MTNTKFCAPNFNESACLKCCEINAINCPNSPNNEEPDFSPVGDTHWEHDFTVDGEERSVHLYKGSDDDVGLIFFKGKEKNYLRLSNQAARATTLLLNKHFWEEEVGVSDD